MGKTKKDKGPYVRQRQSDEGRTTGWVRKYDTDKYDEKGDLGETEERGVFFMLVRSSVVSPV